MAAVKGYKMILTMPENMSQERQSLLRAYGAEIVLTPAADGMAGAIAKAEALLKEIPGSYMCGQFDNPANPMAHYVSTAQEIYADTEGKVASIAAGRLYNRSTRLYLSLFLCILQHIRTHSVFDAAARIKKL